MTIELDNEELQLLRYTVEHYLDIMSYDFENSEDGARHRQFLEELRNLLAAS